MVLFNYSELQLGPNTTRLVRLLPSEKDNTPIRCELFTYVLPESTGRKHLYEALSYVWGSQSETQTITVNGCDFQVTRNLYTALLHLRNHQLQRTIWIDAISINQADDDEKSEQIPLMRSIYAQADRVLVWLGEAMRDGDEALKLIQRLAGDRSLWGEESLDLCSRLSQRDWFKRTWVLQEVGVARCISILCGSVEINGHVFCEGLENCRVPLPSFIYPVLHLIKGSYLRPSFEIDSHGTLALGELLDMYRFHKASMLHDKIYSLLGLCVENPDEVGLKPNYHLPWNEVFKQAIMHVFPSSCSAETWPESPVAVIKGKGLVLGYVGYVQKGILKSGFQQIEVNYNETAHSLGYQEKWGTKWRLRVSAESVEKGNIIFLLKGASSPIIVRLCSGYFTVVVSTTALQSHDDIERSNGVFIPKDFLTKGSLNDIVLVWDISSADGEKTKAYDDQNDLIYLVPHYQEKASEKKNRLQEISLISEGIMIHILQQNRPSTLMKELCQIIRRHGIGRQDHDILIRTDLTNGEICGIIIMEQLLKHCRDSLLVSKNVVAAAAANEKLLGFIVLERLQKYCGKLPVTEDVVKAAAANKGLYGYRIIKKLLQHCGESLPVSEEVIKEAAANRGFYGHMIMEQLLEHCGRGSIIVSEDVIKAATAYRGNYADEIKRQSLEDFDKRLPDLDDLIEKLAAHKEHGQELLLAFGKLVGNQNLGWAAG
ncbi:HET-domain-containing protein [Aspergillus eucalypticola CBS 122712]|uniref:HET-domain-containing protein n=1 Tax=Aspergillus eucalypticola (strain CBS 122712 / IBT 29274) TaxID=1448314 RepID=A0A317V1K0_ASPEC|nr:HET-domain-containing protein [Aspergillus eucalypticola CBS 122712]PWY68204.1 HET-domain-containing protein [Aspergillus eucalypticola CBS 122712]